MSAIVIAERLPPPPPNEVTALQFISAAAALGYITEGEAESWITRNALPAPVLAVLASLPQAQQFPARLRVLGMTRAVRTDPLIGAALSALDLTTAQRDDLFRLAATL